MNKHKVCIIDDDSIFVYGTKILLNYNKHFGDDILVFEDGQEALDAFKNFLKSGEKFPYFIFLDLNMPVMDGSFWMNWGNSTFRITPTSF